MDLQEMYAALEVSHAEEVEMNKKYERQIEFLYNQLKVERDNCKKFEEEKEKVNEYLLKSSQDLESASRELVEVKIQVNKLNKEKVQLTNDLQFVGDLFAKASTEKESLKTQFEDSEREVQKLKEAFQELNRQKVESDSKLTNLEAEVKLLVCSHDLSLKKLSDTH